MKNRKLRWLPPVLWGLLITVLSLMPGGPAGLQLFGIPHIDKIGHFGMYAVWTFLVFYAWKGNFSIPARKLVLLTFLLGSITGIILEFSQSVMALGRSFEVADMLANALGSLAGSLGGTFFRMQNKE